MSFDSHHQTGGKQLLKNNYLNGEAVIVTGTLGLMVCATSIAARMAMRGKGGDHWRPLLMPSTAHACETGSAKHTGEG